MKLVLCGAMLALAVVVLAEEKKQMLLGSDDVDKKHFDMVSGGEGVEQPPTIRGVKRKAKEDRVELKTLKSQVKALKYQIHDESISKVEKKMLKRQYHQLKQSMRAKKIELNGLKRKLVDLKNVKKMEKQKKKFDRSSKVSHRRGGRRNKERMMVGQEEKKINSPESFGLKSEPGSDIVLTKEERKAQRKQAKKAERRRQKQEARQARKGQSLFGNNKGSDRQMAKDEPKLRNASDVPQMNILPFRTHKGQRGGRGGHGKRVKCDTNADCTNGGMCLANRKGRKFCRGMDKHEGKRCHRSEVCARGLKCYVTNPPAGTIVQHKKHKRQKGVCADPATADLTAGYLIPFKTEQPTN